MLFRDFDGLFLFSCHRLFVKTVSSDECIINLHLSEIPSCYIKLPMTLNCLTQMLLPFFFLFEWACLKFTTKVNVTAENNSKRSHS